MEIHERGWYNQVDVKRREFAEIENKKQSIKNTEDVELSVSELKRVWIKFRIVDWYLWENNKVLVFDMMKEQPVIKVKTSGENKTYKLLRREIYG